MVPRTAFYLFSKRQTRSFHRKRYSLALSIGIKRISSRHILLIKWTWLTDEVWLPLWKLFFFCSLLVWGIQVCVNTVLRKKDISSDLREVIAAPHFHFRTTWSQSFYSETDYSTVENIKDSCQSSQQAHPKVSLYNAQRNCKKARSYNLDYRHVG